MELNKRLDVDIDEALASPKFKLKLSPAELDKSLLEFYDKVSESPGGDVIRVIGGGGSIGLQNLYIKRQAQKERKRQGGLVKELFPSFADVDAEEGNRTASQWVRWTLNRTLKEDGDKFVANTDGDTNSDANGNTNGKLTDDANDSLNGDANDKPNGNVSVPAMRKTQDMTAIISSLEKAEAKYERDTPKMSITPVLRSAISAHNGLTLQTTRGASFVPRRSSAFSLLI
jgi:hypothetical protein